MASFWEEFKDLFKTQSRKDEERQQEIAAALEAEKAVTEQLENLDRAYRDTLPEEPEPDLDALFPEDPGYQKVDYTPATDEELAELAGVEIGSKKAGDILDLTSAYDEAVAKVSEQAREAEAKKAEAVDTLTRTYDELMKEAENSATARGLARSSVLSSAVQSLGEAETAGREEAERDYALRARELDEELTRLSEERDAALAQTELEYAAELESRIAELKSERDAEAKKIAEYNNKIAEKEREYALSREEDIAEFLADREKERLEREQKTREEEAKYGYTGEKQKNYAKRYEIAYEFYSSLSPDIAAAALEASPNMRYYLGNYYDKLHDALETEGKKTYF